MKTISVLSRKGGVGKTLISVGVAQTLATHGQVAILDLDPEGTARAWAANAQANDKPLAFAVLSPLELAGRTGIDYLVVDTPPNDPKTLATTAKQSDFIIIPLQPGASEIDRLEPSMDVLRDGHFKEGAQFGLVLNFWEHDNLSAAMPEVIEKLGYPLLAKVKKSVDYRRAFGDKIPEALMAPFKEALEVLGVLEVAHAR